MPGKLILGVVVAIAAAIGVGAVASGGPSEKDFRRQALAACERIAEREAQRVSFAVPKKALEAHRKRVDAALADLRKVEPSGDAEAAWVKAQRLHADALKRVDRSLREMNGGPVNDRKLLEKEENRLDDLIDEAAGQYRTAGVPQCNLRDSETLQAADAYREKADRACARMVRAPLVTPERYGEGRAVALSLVKAVDRELERMELPSKPPESVEPVYRREMLDRLERFRERTRETRARIRDGASPDPAVRRLLRARDNFWDAYFEATYTLRFDQCLEEQAALSRLASTFRRKARRECSGASRAIARASDRQNLEGFREAQNRERALLRRLAKLRPAPRQRLQFRRALAAGRAVERELAKVLARYGTLTPSEAQSYERRLTSLSRRARIAFASLGLNVCGRAF